MRRRSAAFEAQGLAEMSRSDIARLLRDAARVLPPLPRSQFVGFLATLPGGKRVAKRKVHSWHKRRIAPAKRFEQPRQGQLL
jgi:hypothetical protein